MTAMNNQTSNVGQTTKRNNALQTTTNGIQPLTNLEQQRKLHNKQKTTRNKQEP